MAEDKQIKKIIISFIFMAIIAMTVGFSILLKNINVNGNTTISSVWEIKITSIETNDKSNNATNIKNPSYTNTTASFNVSLTQPGDYIEYKVKIENTGTLDATLDTIARSVNDNDAIIFTISNIKKGDALLKGETKEFTIKVEYAQSITSQPEQVSDTLDIELLFKQKI